MLFSSWGTELPYFGKRKKWPSHYKKKFLISSARPFGPQPELPTFEQPCARAIEHNSRGGTSDASSAYSHVSSYTKRAKEWDPPPLDVRRPVQGSP